MVKGVAAGALALLLLEVGTAQAAVTVLDFEDIAPYPNDNTVLVQGYYNGGTSSAGTTAGADFGVDFSGNTNVVCLNIPGTVCSFSSRGGEGDPDSALAGFSFMFGDAAIMSVEAGFDSSLAFFYAAFTSGGSVDIYDGLGGAGNLLATQSLPTTPATCGQEFVAGFCPFVEVEIVFSGVARSVRWNGQPTNIVFDDVTLGNLRATPVPEPASLTLLGAALLGFAAARRRQ